MLLTSIVLPFIAVTMSPGFTDRPLGMFSVAGTTAVIVAGIPSSAIAAIASITAAPPDMSNFISCIFAEGLIEMPPVSKVTALPTKPRCGPRAPRGRQRSTIRRGSA